jgi:pSer/pThr/pTyr-binding forkhead associated (FHA) protein
MGTVVMILNPEGNEGCYIELEKRNYIIGRAEGSDIELDSSTVSRSHAKLTLQAGEWYLEDMESRNGCSLNGKRVKSARLEEGDLFGIGPMTAFFFTESTVQAIEDLKQNFPRLKERALKYGRELAQANKPLLAPSEKVPVAKARAASFGLGKNLTLLSDIASGKLKDRP